MKILIVSQYFWPENFRINDLAVELVKRGHSVTVLTGLPNYPDGCLFDKYVADPGAFLNYNGVEIVRVAIFPRGVGAVHLILNYISFVLTACLLGPLKLRGKSFDAVFTCQLSPVTVGLPGALLAWIKKAPMVMWVLDLWPDTLSALGVMRSPILLGGVAKLVKFIYNRCDLILAQSQSFISKIQRLSKPNVPVVYFPSWAEANFQNKRGKLAPEIPVIEGCFNVMFAGNIGDSQDFGCILSAAELLKSYRQIRWLIVGEGRMLSWVQNEIRSRGLSRCVVLLGRHPIERMPEFFAHADAMLVTLADREAFAMTIPGKIQSYLAAGLPVLGALNGEGAEVIRLANAGYTCRAGNSDDLSKIVLGMSQILPSKRQVFGENGFRFYKQHFNRDRLIDFLEVEIKKVITKNRSSMV